MGIQEWVVTEVSLFSAWTICFLYFMAVGRKRPVPSSSDKVALRGPAGCQTPCIIAPT